LPQEEFDRLAQINHNFTFVVATPPQADAQEVAGIRNCKVAALPPH
jgi:hypothetical protein